MMDKQAFFPDGLKPLSVRVNTSSFKKSWRPADYGVPVHIDRAVGSTGNFKLLGDEYGLECRRIRENLYASLNNIAIKVGDYLWAVPEGESWDKAMHYIRRATNELNSMKAKLRNRYPEAIEEYAEFAETMLEGVGDLVREKAYDWSYLEQRLQVVVYTSYEASAKAKVYEGVSERVEHCLKALRKGHDYKISKYTAEQLQSIIDWCSGMSAYEEPLMAVARAVEKVKDLIPEVVKTKEPYAEISQSIADCLVSIQEHVIAQTSDVVTTVVHSSVSFSDTDVVKASVEKSATEVMSDIEREAMLDLFV